MERSECYIVTVNGIPHEVSLCFTVPEEPLFYDPGPIIQPPAPASWVTARRVSHLPPH